MIITVRSILAFCLAIIALNPASIGASVYELGFSTLPTLQGWTYAGSGAATNYYGVNGTSLVQTNTPFNRTTWFERPITLFPDEDFRLTIEARVTSFSGLPGLPFGFFFSLSGPDSYNYFGISGAVPAYVDTADVSRAFSFPPGFDLSRFNRFEVTGHGNVASLAIDGVTVVLLADLSPLSTSARVIQFGDGTSGGQASAEVRKLRFETGADVGAVPEPATWATMILGFGLVGGALRRRDRPATA